MRALFGSQQTRNAVIGDAKRNYHARIDRALVENQPRWLLRDWRFSFIPGIRNHHEVAQG